MYAPSRNPRAASSTLAKIRRVGNSNVISLPKTLERLGYTIGTSVVVEELESGELRVVPVSGVREMIRETGRRVGENREALEILERHDRQGYSPAGRSRARGEPRPGPQPVRGRCCRILRD